MDVSSREKESLPKCDFRRRRRSLSIGGDATSYRIEEIEGIGPVNAASLAAAGITHTATLLVECASAPGRARVARITGLSEGVILNWTNLADLMRIKGVGLQYAELLHRAGVDTVKELTRRSASSLTASLIGINREEHLSGRAPAPAWVGWWIDQARRLDPLITY